MKIIALYGRASIGKTKTLRLVVEALEKQPHAISDRRIDSQDIRALITIGNFKIGIETGGDVGTHVSESLDLFVRESCHVAVCATRTKYSTVDAVKLRATPENIKWIEKVSGETEEDRCRIASETASKIVDLVLEERNQS